LELKRGGKRYLRKAVSCFNCTILELKPALSLEPAAKVFSFNCTILELKLDFNRSCEQFYAALIVPFWN